jgi:hypothetical protein
MSSSKGLAKPKLKQSFLISDTGEVVDSIFREQQSSSIYGTLIGRGQVIPNRKSTFNVTDITYEGFLSKRGTYFRTW